MGHLDLDLQRWTPLRASITRREKLDLFLMCSFYLTPIPTPDIRRTTHLETMRFVIVIESQFLATFLFLFVCEANINARVPRLHDASIGRN
ncbi:hypothetical protein Rmet_2841 [Cupriavidus metallidurans CH34]|uniref:Uncharacterized protein n=1 Tax=Cupriavidus metallidurans (strain ATCC 43123 / DSM 2839 / NBRC 102507 / CH34) TaxID=266264 RepID=Q1LJG2_CUPMC|nr:hypothetical protein Rmet_2841 [Cupriavidus metallidurans CH34]